MADNDRNCVNLHPGPAKTLSVRMTPKYIAFRKIRCLRIFEGATFGFCISANRYSRFMNPIFDWT